MTRMLLSTFLLFLVLSPASGDDIDAEAEALQALFMPPCCFTGLLKDHQSPAADEMKEEIRAFLEQGKSEKEIVDHYVEVYGERILSQPPEKGFNRLAVLAPLLALGAGVLVIGSLFRRRRRAPRGEENTPPSSPLDPEIDDRIEREIRRGM